MPSEPDPDVLGSTRGALPPWVTDAFLGLGVAAVVSLVIAADVDGGAVDPTAYLWAVGLGALLLVRRRHPALVVWLSVLGLLAYYASGNPPVGVAVPVAAAVFSAAELGRLLAATTASLAVLAVSVTFRLVEGQDAGYVLGYELVGHVLLLAAAIALGDAVRSRRATRDGARQVAALEAERAQRETEARRREERLALARDLHDSIGHAGAVVALHTNVAREAVGRDDATVTAALDVVAETTSTSLHELRRTVAVLRSDGADAPDRARDVPDAVRAARRAGLEVTGDVDLPDPLPAPVAAAAYRIVQESLTNVLRHAPGARAVVEVHAAGGELQVVVRDDGAAVPPSDDVRPAAGHGLSGMRERAARLGGRLEAGPTATGFAVVASLPLVPPSSTLPDRTESTESAR